MQQKMCNLTAEDSKDQECGLVDEFVGLNNCEILLDSGAQTPVSVVHLSVPSFTVSGTTCS